MCSPTFLLLTIFLFVFCLAGDLVVVDGRSLFFVTFSSDDTLGLLLELSAWDSLHASDCVAVDDGGDGVEFASVSGAVAVVAVSAAAAAAVGVESQSESFATCWLLASLQLFLWLLLRAPLTLLLLSVSLVLFIIQSLFVNCDDDVMESGVSE